MATRKQSYTDDLGRMIEDRTGIVGQMLRYNREQKEYEKAITRQVGEINEVTTRVKNTSSTLLSMERSFIQISKNVQYLAEAMGAYVTLQEETDKGIQQQQPKKTQQAKKLQRELHQAQKEEDEGFNLFDELFRRWTRLPQSKKRRGPGRRGRGPKGPRKIPRGASRVSLGKSSRFVRALSTLGRGASRFIPGVGQVLLVGELAYLIYDDIAAKRDANKASEAAKKYRDTKLEEAKQTAIQRKEDQKLTEQEARDLLAVPGITDAELNLFGGREAVQRRAGIVVPTPASTAAREESSAERLARLGIAGTTVGGGRGSILPPMPAAQTEEGQVAKPLPRAVPVAEEDRKEPLREVQQMVDRGEIYQPAAVPPPPPPTAVAKPTAVVQSDGRFTNATDFAATLFPYAQDVSRRIGGNVPPLAILGQWAGESGMGKNLPADFNYAGIKAGTKFAKGSYVLTEEKYTDEQLRRAQASGETLAGVLGPNDKIKKQGRMFTVDEWFGKGAWQAARDEGKNWVQVKSYFAKFKDFSDFASAFAAFISSPRYAKAREQTTAAGFGLEIARAGYATNDPKKYSEKVAGFAAKYGSEVGAMSTNVAAAKRDVSGPGSVNYTVNNNTITQQTASAGNMGRRHAGVEYTSVAGAA